MANSSKLVTVMSQLFPFLVGGTLNLKEIVANKDLIATAIFSASEKGVKVDGIRKDNTHNTSESGVVIGGAFRSLCYIPYCKETVWKWFSDNFLSLTFVKGEGLHFSEHPIHIALCVATAITKLHSRLRIESTVTEEEQDTVHSLKYRFEQWGHSSEFGSDFNIGLDEISIIHRLLMECKEKNSFNNMSSVNENKYWITETIKSIHFNTTSCLEYVNTLL